MSALWIVVASLQLADIPPAYRTAARDADAPAAVLYAIALTESGRQTAVGRRPWPWTLNVAGRGLYFANRSSAWRQLQRTFAAHRNVDIGLMQVSWRYHSTTLRSTWHALDPQWNLSVGARILRRCFEERRTWAEAVGCYHAPNNSARANAYRQRVARALARLMAQ
ncbi:MAG: transglycosylase SLT domain-containing protein [Gammaproteobacteria bacterium]